MDKERAPGHRQLALVLLDHEEEPNRLVWGAVLSPKRVYIR